MFNRISQFAEHRTEARHQAAFYDNEDPANFFGEGIKVNDESFIPYEGYRKSSYTERHEEGNRLTKVIRLSIQAHRDKLAQLFIALSDVLSQEIDIYADSRHDLPPDGTVPEYFAEGVDLVVVQSALWGGEELLVHDGATSIDLCDWDRDLQLHLSNSKVVYCFGGESGIKRFHPILDRFGIPFDEDLLTVASVPHEKKTWPLYEHQFSEMMRDVGAEPLDD